MLKLTHSTIRPFRPTDAASLAEHANNRKVWRNLRDLMPHPYSVADAQEFLARELQIEHPRVLPSTSTAPRSAQSA